MGLRGGCGIGRVGVLFMKDDGPKIRNVALLVLLWTRFVVPLYHAFQPRCVIVRHEWLRCCYVATSRRNQLEGWYGDRCFLLLYDNLVITRLRRDRETFFCLENAPFYPREYTRIYESVKYESVRSNSGCGVLLAQPYPKVP